jgi:hypothetical protein
MGFVSFCHATVNRGSSVSMATRLRAGPPGLDFGQGQDIIRFSIASRPALGPSPGTLPRGLSDELEADQSPPSSA